MKKKITYEIELIIPNYDEINEKYLLEALKFSVKRTLCIDEIRLIDIRKVESQHNVIN